MKFKFFDQVNVSMKVNDFIKIVKDFAGRLIFYSRLYRLFFRGKTLIVAFHSVNDIHVSRTFNCTPESFRRYCVFLKKYFDVRHLTEILRDLENGNVSCKAAITFDDGYKDNSTVAMPILESLNLPATIFVITDVMGERRENGPFTGIHGPNEWMDWHDLRELMRRGIEIGCHTKSHVDLGRASLEIVRDEIHASRIEMANNLGTPPTLFAFPYGGPFNISDAAIEEVKSAGFLSSVSCYGGIADSSADIFQLPREPISTWYYSCYHFGFEMILRVLRGNKGLSRQLCETWGM